MCEIRDELKKVRTELKTQMKTIRQLCDVDVELGFKIEVGVEDYVDSGNAVRSRVCSLDSPHVTVLNVIMGNGGRLPAYKTSRIVHIFVVDGTIVDLISGKGTHAGQVFEINPYKLFELRSDYARLVITFKPAFE
jgi:hypothetical protein